MTINAALMEVRGNITRTAAQWERSSADITLIAVSKTQPIEMIEQALIVGQRDFGENRVQEAKAKFPLLRQKYTDLRLHLIGPLQTNKVPDAVALADIIHTLDRQKLADSLAKEMRAQKKRPDLFIQVNIGNEPQKAGIAIDAIEPFITYCRDLGLPVIGLMAIPPLDEDPSPYFALLAKIGKDHNLHHLSMGMSADYQKAIALGATHIRVGSAIFGERARLAT